MNKPAFRVVAFDHATCDADYCGTETTTKPCAFDGIKLHTPFDASPEARPTATVTVRIRDIMPALQHAGANKLSWVRDFADDPVVITRDLYDVLLTLERLKRTA
ncbi:MAG: hypothetical protein ABL921_00010 [Pirellula sp.]